MAGSPPTSMRSRLPRGLLGMMILVVAAEHFVARHVDDLYLNVSLWNWRRTSEIGRQMGPRAKVLCFGDSLTKSGLAAPIIESRTGRDTLNLALNGGQAPGSYFMFRRALESGGQPDAVLVNFMPRLLMFPYRDSKLLWAELLTLPSLPQVRGPAACPAPRPAPGGSRTSGLPPCRSPAC